MAESYITRKGGGGGATLIEYTNFYTNQFVVSGGLVKQPNATDLSLARAGLLGATVGNYALFAGRYNENGSNVIDAYDINLTRTTPVTLSFNLDSDGPYTNKGGSNLGNFAIFTGGRYNSTVNAINSSLVRSIPTSLSQWRVSISINVFANTAWIAAGRYIDGGSSTRWLDNIELYNTSLTRSVINNGPYGEGIDAGTTNDYIIFSPGDAGFSYTGNSNYLPYNSSLVKQNTVQSGINRFEAKGGQINDNVIFAGGLSRSTGSLRSTGYVLSFNNSLTASVRTALAVVTTGHATVSMPTFVLFAGGYQSSISGSPSTSAVNSYNSSISRTSVSGLTNASTALAAARVGDKALLAGGDLGPTNTSTRYSTVNVYEDLPLVYNYNLQTPSLTSTPITYKYNFTGFGSGNINAGNTLTHSSPFTGTLEFPAKITKTL
jgi:hypothetical protein